MKKFIVLTIFLSLSLNTFSQSLKPIVSTNNGETHFCFTLWQSKYIAKSLEKASLQGQIIVTLENQKTELISLQKVKDSTIVFLEKKIENQSLVIDNKNLAYSQLETNNKTLRRKVKRQRFSTKLLGGALIVLSGILIIK